MIGLIKAVLRLRHEAVPPQVHFSKLNPHISLAGTRLAIPTALTPWPVGRAAALRGGQLVRRRRHQRPRHRRGSAHMAATPTERGCGRSLHPAAVGAKYPRPCGRWRSPGAEFLTETSASVVRSLPHGLACGAPIMIIGSRWSARTKEELSARLRTTLT